MTHDNPKRPKWGDPNFDKDAPGVKYGKLENWTPELEKEYQAIEERYAREAGKVYNDYEKRKEVEKEWAEKQARYDAMSPEEQEAWDR